MEIECKKHSLVCSCAIDFGTILFFQLSQIPSNIGNNDPSNNKWYNYKYNIRDNNFNAAKL